MLPTKHAHDMIADCKLRVTALLDNTYGCPLHGLAERLRRRITFCIVHPPTHVGVERHVVITHEQLTVLKIRKLLVFKTETITGDHTTWTRSENDSTVMNCHNNSLKRYKFKQL